MSDDESKPMPKVLIPPDVDKPEALRAWMNAAFVALHPANYDTGQSDRALYTGMVFGMLVRLIDERQRRGGA